jgi:hypothetical protein
MSLIVEIRRLVEPLREQGIRLMLLSLGDKVLRWVGHGPTSRFSRITGDLWLGGQPSKRILRRLFRNGFTGFINMRGEHDYAELVPVGERRYLRLPTTDNEAPTLEHLGEGADFIREEIAQGGRVYVHCWEGIGRGPTMAAAYFVTEGMTPEEAWARVRKGRPFVRPRPSQRARVEEFAAWYTPRTVAARVAEEQGPSGPAGSP